MEDLNFGTSYKGKQSIPVELQDSWQYEEISWKDVLSI